MKLTLLCKPATKHYNNLQGSVISWVSHLPYEYFQTTKIILTAVGTENVHQIVNISNIQTFFNHIFQLCPCMNHWIYFSAYLSSIRFLMCCFDVFSLSCFPSSIICKLCTPLAQFSYIEIDFYNRNHDYHYGNIL